MFPLLSEGLQSHSQKPQRVKPSSPGQQSWRSMSCDIPASLISIAEDSTRPAKVGKTKAVNARIFGCQNRRMEERDNVNGQLNL
jgi:hypothetical protein